MMKLYYHPVSTTSRPIMLFAAESGLALDFELVDLFKGEHLNEAYCRIRKSFRTSSGTTKKSSRQPSHGDATKARPHWRPVNEAFYTHLIAPYVSAAFEEL